jgi:hypothetical protein
VTRLLIAVLASLHFATRRYDSVAIAVRAHAVEIRMIAREDTRWMDLRALTTCKYDVVVVSLMILGNVVE